MVNIIIKGRNGSKVVGSCVQYVPDYRLKKELVVKAKIEWNNKAWLYTKLCLHLNDTNG